MASGTPVLLPSTASLAAVTDVVAATGVVMQMPFRMGLKPDLSDAWTFPLEPLVSVRGANILARRAIAKSPGVGAVIERFAQDNWQVGVVGMFIGGDPEALPEEEIDRLKTLLTSGKSVYVQCALLDLLGIGSLAIETFEFVPTPGINNQEYQFSGYSDSNFELF